MSASPAITETIETTRRIEMIDLTRRVEQLVGASGVVAGMVVVYVPHTTAGVTINEHADPDVQTDLLAKLGQLVPDMESYYQHDEGNSDAHVKAALVGSSVTILIENGRPLLGRWQGVFFCEFDGPRERHWVMKVMAA